MHNSIVDQSCSRNLTLDFGWAAVPPRIGQRVKRGHSQYVGVVSNVLSVVAERCRLGIAGPRLQMHPPVLRWVTTTCLRARGETTTCYRARGETTSCHRNGKWKKRFFRVAFPMEKSKARFEREWCCVCTFSANIVKLNHCTWSYFVLPDIVKFEVEPVQRTESNLLDDCRIFIFL